MKYTAHAKDLEEGNIIRFILTPPPPKYVFLYLLSYMVSSFQQRKYMPSEMMGETHKVVMQKSSLEGEKLCG